MEDYEDLLSPNFDTLESLRETRKDGCNVYVILLANGLQTARLLRFGDRYTDIPLLYLTIKKTELEPK